jgi:capsular polysaccharide biosynthesis protein
MNPNSSISFLKKNSLLIIGVGLIAAGVAWFFTRHEARVYSSSATVYTGLATETSPDCLTTARFDNLVNIIKSRETIEMTAIRLMARYLLLTSPDPSSCLPETWVRLMNDFPLEIRKMAEMIEPELQINSNHDTVSQYVTEKVKRSRLIPEYYTIRAGDSPKEVCLKFGISLDQLERLNSPMPPFNGGSRLIVGIVSEPYWADTLINIHTPADTSLILSEARINTDSLRFEHLVKKLTGIKNADQDNYIIRTLQSQNPYYSIRKISEIRVLRLQNSDMISLTYDSNDPGVSLQTLKTLTEVFLSQYQSLSPSNSDKLPVIRMIDNPVYPLQSDGSKRIILVIAAFLAGFLLMLLILLIRGWIDRSIRFPDRFGMLTGLKVIGAIPRIPGRQGNKIDYPLVISRSIDQIAQRIRMVDIGLKDRGDQSFLIFFVSTRGNEGKTYIASMLVEKLRATGSKVLFLKPLERNSPEEDRLRFTSFDRSTLAWDFEYAVPDNFVSVRDITELIRNYTFLIKGYHFLVVELPALLTQEFPLEMVRSGHLSVLTTRASRNWTRADQEALTLYRSSLDHPVYGVLNDCDVDQMASFIGDIPKR